MFKGCIQNMKYVAYFLYVIAQLILEVACSPLVSVFTLCVIPPPHPQISTYLWLWKVASPPSFFGESKDRHLFRGMTGDFQKSGTWRFLTTCGGSSTTRHSTWRLYLCFAALLETRAAEFWGTQITFYFICLFLSPLLFFLFSFFGGSTSISPSFAPISSSAAYFICSTSISSASSYFFRSKPGWSLPLANMPI